MKKFLLPLSPFLLTPSIANAFPWGNKDIIVKTDLGEQYIVKDSAVTVLNFGKKEAFGEIEESANYTTRELKRCADGPLGYDKCAGIYKPEEKKQKVIDWKNTINSEEKNIHFVGIRFRPIFVDLNNQKSALDYDKVGCLNPNIKPETLKFWNYFTSIISKKGKKAPDYYNAPAEFSTLAYEQMRYEICKKYAKF